ncbi:MAG TPA: hypothetical protein VII93_12135 [Anaerolineales bacterium]
MTMYTIPLSDSTASLENVGGKGMSLAWSMKTGQEAILPGFSSA